MMPLHRSNNYSSLLIAALSVLALTACGAPNENGNGDNNNNGAQPEGTVTLTVGDCSEEIEVSAATAMFHSFPEDHDRRGQMTVEGIGEDALVNLVMVVDHELGGPDTLDMDESELMLIGGNIHCAGQEAAQFGVDDDEFVAADQQDDVSTLQLTAENWVENDRWQAIDDECSDYEDGCDVRVGTTSVQKEVAFSGSRADGEATVELDTALTTWTVPQ